MSDRSYQLDFTIKYNIKYVYLIDGNLIFGGKFRFFMSDVEWRRYEGKSFSLKKQSLFLESLVEMIIFPGLENLIEFQTCSKNLPKYRI